MPVRWWLWPHVLGLDAPAVALTWQDWWARQSGAHLTFSQRGILGLGVWLIYLADRLADAARGLGGDRSPARHRFAARWRRPLTTLAIAVAACLTILAPLRLAAVEFCKGIILLVAAGGYFWLIHRRSAARWSGIVPKEAVVGAVFAIGTAFFALGGSARPAGPLVVAILLFGVACFLNCALISAWERTPSDQCDRYSLLNAFPALVNGGLRRWCWRITALSLAATLCCQTPIFVPVAISAAILGILDLCRHRFADDALRCLVDLALLMPLVCSIPH